VVKLFLPEFAPVTAFPATPPFSSEFDRCLELLQELETRGESSGPVLRHNRAVVSYHKTGCTQHSVLLKELEALTADADAPGEASSGLSLKQGAAAATVARYNRAVIYYHRHMFGTALEKLDSQIVFILITLLLLIIHLGVSCI